MWKKFIRRSRKESNIGINKLKNKRSSVKLTFSKCNISAVPLTNGSTDNGQRTYQRTTEVVPSSALLHLHLLYSVFPASPLIHLAPPSSVTLRLLLHLSNTSLFLILLYLTAPSTPLICFPYVSSAVYNVSSILLSFCVL